MSGPVSAATSSGSTVSAAVSGAPPALAACARLSAPSASVPSTAMAPPRAAPPSPPPSSAPAMAPMPPTCAPVRLPTCSLPRKSRARSPKPPAAPEAAAPAPPSAPCSWAKMPSRPPPVPPRLRAVWSSRPRVCVCPPIPSCRIWPRILPKLMLPSHGTRREPSAPPGVSGRAGAVDDDQQLSQPRRFSKREGSMRAADAPALIAVDRGAEQDARAAEPPHGAHGPMRLAPAIAVSGAWPKTPCLSAVKPC